MLGAEVIEESVDERFFGGGFDTGSPQREGLLGEREAAAEVGLADEFVADAAADC